MLDKESNYPQLQAFITKNILYSKNKNSEINLSAFGLKELKVTLNPDNITYQNLKIAWIKKYPKTEATFYKSIYPYFPKDKNEMK